MSIGKTSHIQRQQYETLKKMMEVFKCRAEFELFWLWNLSQDVLGKRVEFPWVYLIFFPNYIARIIKKMMEALKT